MCATGEPHFSPVRTFLPTLVCWATVPRGQWWQSDASPRLAATHAAALANPFATGVAALVAAVIATGLEADIGARSDGLPQQYHAGHLPRAPARGLLALDGRHVHPVQRAP